MGDVTLVQGILLAVMAFIVGIDFWLEGLFIFRPLIVATLTGLILGDLKTGLVCGGITELSFAGLTPAGGTQPPNPVLAGIMTTVIAHTTGVSANEVLGLALPFSFLMQYILLFYYSVFTVFMPKLDKAAEEADVKAFKKYNMIPIIIVAATYALVVFLSAYVAQDAMKALVESLPEWLSHGLGVAGGILPAVGFGMLLNVMLKKEYIPYFIIGFVAASFIDFSNLLPIALLGTAFALMEYNNSGKVQKGLESLDDFDDDDEDGDYTNGI